MAPDGSARVASNVPKRPIFTVCSDSNRPCGSVMLTLNSLFSGTAYAVSRTSRRIPRSDTVSPG